MATTILLWVCYIILFVLIVLPVYTLFYKYLYSRLTKNGYKHIIRQCCKKGKYNDLVTNCKQIVADYANWRNCLDISKFYQREYVLSVFRETFCMSYVILDYLDKNPQKLSYYTKLNDKYARKQHNKHK